MASVRRASTALLAALLAAGCVPDRDNPHDPSLRPTAVLEIANVDEAFCDPLDPGQVVRSPVMSHGRCLVLSAAGSSDPQDDRLTYTFDVFRCESGCSGPECISRTVVSDTAASAIFTSEELVPAYEDELEEMTEPPESIERCARVVVRDGDGHSHASETARLQLTNEPPVAISPGFLQAPAYGAIWTDPPGPLDLWVSGAASFDHDSNADLREYCWTLTGGAELVQQATPDVTAGTACSAATNLVLEVAPGAGVVFLDLEVRDRWGAASAPVPVVVQLAQPPTWAQDLQGIYGIAIDVTRDVFTLSSALSGSPAFRFDDAEPKDSRIYYGVARGAGFHIAGSEIDDDASALSTALAAGEVPRKLVLDTERGVLWTLTVNELTGSLSVSAYDEDTLALHDTWLAPGSSGSGFGQFNTALEADGTLWVVPLFEADAFALRFDDVNGVIAEEPGFQASPGHVYSCVTIRDTDQGQEVWLIEIANFLTDTPIDAPSATILAADGSFLGAGFFVDEDTGAAFGLEFVDEDTAWITFARDDEFLARALSLSFAPDPDSEGDVLLSTRTETPVRLGKEFIVVQATGLYGMMDFSETGLTGVSLDGSATTNEGVDEIMGLQLQPGNLQRNPSLWVTLMPPSGPPALVVRGLGSLRNPFLLRAPRPLAAGPIFADYASGDAWGTGFVPRGLFRMGGNGRISDLIGNLEENGIASPMPFAGQVLSDPASGALWVFETGAEQFLSPRIFRIDPNVPRPDPSTAALAGFSSRLAIPQEQFLPGGGVQALEGSFVGSTLARTAEGHTDCEDRWDGAGEGHCFYLRRIAADGTPVLPPLFVSSSAGPGFAFAPDMPRIARDLTDGGVCVARLASATTPATLVVTRLAADLSPEWTGATFATDAEVVSGAAAYGGRCWVAWTGAAGSFVARVTGPGAGEALLTLATPRAPATSLAAVIGADAVFRVGADGSFETLVPFGPALVPAGATTLPEPVFLAPP